jgi:outer membrane receptor protein involved in Fe transport
VFDHYYDTVFPDYNYEGATCPNSPEWSMTASYRHIFTLWSYGTMTPSVDWQYRSGFDLTYNTKTLEMSGEPDPGYTHQEAYSLYNASISFQPSGSHWLLSHWSLNASVKNITNYAVKRSYQSREETLMLGDPRTYSATFSLRF